MSLSIEKFFTILLLLTFSFIFFGIFTLHSAHAATIDACYGYNESGVWTYYPAGSDNCYQGDGWTDVQLSEFSPTTITVGQTATIQASTQDADWCDGVSGSLWTGRLATGPDAVANFTLTTPSSLTPGTYTQAIRCGGAASSNIETSPTRTLTVVAAPPTPPSPAPVLTISPGACGTGQLVLSWSASNGAAQYTVQYFDSGAWVDAVSVNAPQQSYTFSGLPANTTYSVRIVASNSGGSATSAAVSATTPSSCSSSFTITSSAGTGGSISPLGSVGVSSGGSQSFTITPGSGYIIATVDVDGSNVGAAGSYTFNNVTSNHTIHATFSPTTPPPSGPNLSAQSITTSGGPFVIGASMTLSGVVVNNGTTNVTNAFSDNFTYQWGGVTGPWQSFAGNSVSEGSGLAAGANLNDSVVFTPSQSGTLYIQYCVDSTGVVSETDESVGDNCRISAGLIINATTSPTNLTAQSLTLSNGPYSSGAAITLNGSVTNNSSNSTGSGFSDNFTYQWGGTGGAWQTFSGNTITGGALSAGHTANEGPVYFTPSQSGTLYIQYCVDSTGAITETDESVADNCKVSSAIIVDGPPLGFCPSTTINHCELPIGFSGQRAGTCSAGYISTCSYTCSGSSWTYNNNSCTGPLITQLEICLWNGSSATGCGTTVNVATGTPLAIRWNSQNADNCARQSGPADFGTGGAVSGIDTTVTASANVNTTSTYTLICTRGGAAASADTRSVRAVTTGVAPLLTVSKSIIHTGDSITVSWDTNNNDESLCSLTGGGLTSSTLTNGTGGPETGNADVTITGRTTFILTCGGLSDVKSVEIIPRGWES